MGGWWNEPTTRHAYKLSLISVLLTAFAMIFGILLFVVTRSVLCLVFGLENLVDYISSLVVLWRFYAPSKLTPDIEEKLKKREERASMAVSIILIILGLMVIIMSLASFAQGKEDELEYSAVLAISCFSIPIFGALSIFKFRYASRLDSSSLNKDGICSLIGTFLAVAMFIDSLIVRASPGLWWIDPLVALFSGFAAMFIGIQAIIETEQPIANLSWWLTSQGTLPSSEGTLPYPDAEANGIVEENPEPPATRPGDHSEGDGLQTLELTDTVNQGDR